MNQNRIEDRLARLEAENRRLKRVGLGALAGLGALTLMSFAAPALCDTVWAERFVLRDAQNNTRVTLNAYATDTPSIAFHDRRGKKIGSVGIDSEGSFALATYVDGKAMPAAFEVDDKGALRLCAATAGKRAQVVKEVSEEGIN